MAESTPSASKTLTWLLTILLIGVVALYTWHNNNQKEVLTSKDAEIAHSAQLIADTEQKLGQATATEQSLRGEIEALNAQHSTEKQELTGQLDAAAQANQSLQGQHDDANQQIAALSAEMEQQKQAMAAAAAAHETQMAEAQTAHQDQMTEAQTAHEAQALQLKSDLNEKVNFYRTALEGSDPERAAQLVGLELQIQADQKTIAEAQQTMQTLQEKEVGLGQQLDSANQVIAERDRALADAGQRLEGTQAELKQGQDALAALQQKHETAVAQAADKHAAAQQQLKDSEERHASTKAEAASAIQAAEGNISDLTGKLQAEAAAHVALQQKHKSTVADLTASLDSTKQTLAGVEAELSATKDAAAQAQQAQEQQIGEAKGQITELEGTLEQTRQKATEDLVTSKREGEEAVTYVRGVYTEFLKLDADPTDKGMRVSLAEDDLRFGVNKTDLPEGEYESLDFIAELLSKYPQLTVRIEGHTDSSGREETNFKLSQERAAAVKQALVDRAVAAERMTSVGLGPQRPIADNNSSAGRSQNRRVEVYVIEN